MPNPGYHAMMAQTTHDENARLDFICTFKEHVTGPLAQGNRAVYDKEVEPHFVRAHNRPPLNRHEVHRGMRDNDYWQMYGSLFRLCQELKQDYGGDPVHRQIGSLIDKARGYRDNATKGSLRLDENLEIPRYHTAVDIHCLPGGYHTEGAPDDVTSGAMYDPGVYFFAMGAMGEYNEDMGVSLIRWLGQEHPDFKPRRILDMGCTVGHCTIPYAEAFPDAELHASDVAAPVLRYAHARAEAMGHAVHFSQQNAERTDFEDGSFDLIVSHIMLHETSRRAIYNIMQECHRLLRPGGMVVHAEAPVENAKLAPFDAFMRDWATHYNAEPFWGTLHDMDLDEPALQAGFAKDNMIHAHTHKELGGGTGLTGGASWLLYGATK